MFRGEFYPSETVVPRDPAYRTLQKASNDLLETLKERLKGEDFQLVEQLLEQDLNVRCMECECHFRYGFSAGLLLVQEAQLELQSRRQPCGGAARLKAAGDSDLAGIVGRPVGADLRGQPLRVGSSTCSPASSSPRPSSPA